MPSTVFRGWPYPSEYEDPYWVNIENTFEAIDVDVNALMTGVRSVPLGGTGQSALTAGSYLKGNGTSAVAFQAAPIPVVDGGSGATSFTAGRYLKGNATGAFVEQAPPIPVADGGTGAITLTGYLKGNGVGAFTAQLTPIPVADGGTGAASYTAGSYLKGNGTGAFTTQAAPIPVADGGTGAASFPANQILYGNGTGALLSSPNLTFDATAGELVIDLNNAPVFRLGVHSDTPAETWPWIHMQSTRGTKAAPTNTQNADGLFYIAGGGHPNAYAAEIWAQAAANWTTGSTPSSMHFTTTGLSGTSTTRLLIGHDGGITFPAYAGYGTCFPTMDNNGRLGGPAAIPLAVGYGGTGAGTFPASQILYGNGASAVASSANLKWDGTVLSVRSGGTSYVYLTHNGIPGNGAHVGMYAYVGSNGGADVRAGGFYGIASQAWSGAGTGMSLYFNVCPDNTSTEQTAMILHQNRNVQFNGYATGSYSYLFLSPSGVLETRAWPFAVPDGGTGATSFTANRAIYGNGSGPLLTSNRVVMDLSDTAAYGAIHINSIAANTVGLSVSSGNTGGTDPQTALHLGRAYSVYNASIDVTFGRQEWATGGIVNRIRSTLTPDMSECGQLDFMCQHGGGATVSVLKLDGNAYSSRAIINAWEGWGLRIDHPNAAGADRRYGLVFRRPYTDGGDTHAIVWDGGAGSNAHAAIEAYVIGGGELSLMGYCMSAGGSAFSYQVFRFDGSGYTAFPRGLGGGGTRLVYCDNNGGLGGTAIPLSIANGGTNNTAFNPNMVLFYNGSVIQQNDAIAVNAGIGVNRAVPAVGWIDVAGGVMKNGLPYSNPAYVFEHWATGKIEKFADREGADKYPGVRPLDEIEHYVREHHEHPLLQGDMIGGLFGTVDRTIECVEEAYIYLFQLNKEVKLLRESVLRLESLPCRCLS